MQQLGRAKDRGAEYGLLQSGSRRAVYVALRATSETCVVVGAHVVFIVLMRLSVSVWVSACVSVSVVGQTSN